MNDNYAVAARFYVKKGDNYYADYTNNNETYDVCAAAYSDLA